jgi:peptidoglycan hydrolase-like protein with peptidoglycan-binding domain
MRQELLEDAPRRRWPRVAVAIVVAAGLCAAGAVVVLGGSKAPSRAAVPATRGTVAVERRTLVKRSSQSGTLGYSGKRTVIGRLAGTVTWLPGAGRVIRRGERLYSLDGLPVVLMYGPQPAYRTLQQGVSLGADVLQLELNLAALGFGSRITVDGKFTAATAAAVKRWQRSLGLRATGVVRLGRVLFLPGPRRVGQLKVSLGASGGSGGGNGSPASGSGSGASDSSAPSVEIMETTSLRRVVTVQLDAGKQALARVGAAVSIALPNGRAVTGRITGVGKVAVASGSGGGGGPGDSGSTSNVTVTIHTAARRRVTTFDQAPVTVDFAEAIRRHVLSVPVTALTATAGGGYALLLPGGRQLPVSPGMFTDGYVEISGEGVHAGLRVLNA